MASASENILPCPPLPAAPPCRAPAAKLRPSICLAIIIGGSVASWAAIFEIVKHITAML